MTTRNLSSTALARFTKLLKSGVGYRTALALADRVTDDDLAGAVSNAVGTGSPKTAVIVTGPTLPVLATGTEYVWNKTDGAGILLDIISGVAA